MVLRLDWTQLVVQPLSPRPPSASVPTGQPDHGPAFQRRVPARIGQNPAGTARTVVFCASASLETAKTVLFDIFTVTEDVFAPAGAVLRDANATLRVANVALSIDNATLSTANVTLSTDNATLRDDNVTLRVADVTMRVGIVTLSIGIATLCDGKMAFPTGKTASRTADGAFGGAERRAGHSQRPAGRGLPRAYGAEMWFDARPHLNPLPRGEDLSQPAFWFGGRPSGQSSRWYFPRRGARFSLSLEERAGVRTVVQPIYCGKRRIFVRVCVWAAAC